MDSQTKVSMDFIQTQLLCLDNKMPFMFSGSLTRERLLSYELIVNIKRQAHYSGFVLPEYSIHTKEVVHEASAKLVYIGNN